MFENIDESRWHVILSLPSHLQILQVGEGDQLFNLFSLLVARCRAHSHDLIRMNSGSITTIRVGNIDEGFLEDGLCLTDLVRRVRRLLTELRRLSARVCQ